MSKRAPQPGGGTTDHTEEIDRLKYEAARYKGMFEYGGSQNFRLQSLARTAAAELLRVHDTSGIVIDEWTEIREFIEFFIGDNFLESHV